MAREESPKVNALNPDPKGLFSFEVHADVRVSGRLLVPDGARALYVLAHGAGAGMDHPSMRAIATDLADLGVATLRYQFPYMEQHKARPDPPALCHATVRAAIAAGAQRAPQLPTFAGGRSFGGRMTSQAQARRALPGVRGLVFLAFPLHAARQPSDERARHLADVNIPMLFVQGTRDALAERTLIENAVARLGARATLAWVENADHSFHVPARSGRSDGQVRRELLARAVGWMVGLP
jgi:predicted alpha/beta-hydrolase family hydrolase